MQGVGNHEVSVYPASRGLLPRDRQCGLSHIDSQNVQPQGGDAKGVLACPAFCIEDCAGECALARPASAEDQGSEAAGAGELAELARYPR